MSALDTREQVGLAEPGGGREFGQRSLGSIISARTLAAVAGIVIVVVALEITSSGKLLTGSNIGSLLDASAEIGFVALGVTMLMIGGEFDLSVGQALVASGMTFASTYHDIGWAGGLALGLGVALLIGLFNGAATLTLKIPSFITTLGTYYIVGGIILMLSGGAPISAVSKPPLFKVLASFILGSTVRWEVVWWLGLAAILAFVLHRTSFGNHVFAAGGDQSVARGVGVNVPRTKMILFVLSSVLAGFGGIVIFVHLGSAAPSEGSGLQLEAIAAAVIGGVSLFGGIGTEMGGVIGAIFLGVVSVGLVLSGASTLYYELYVGIVLVLAVGIQVRAEGIGRVTKRLRAMGGGLGRGGAPSA
jgi:simple sugar transport system permease protein